MRRTLALALLALAAAPAASHGDVLARIPNESAVSVYRSTAVVSVLGRDDVYRLAVVRNGRAVPLPGVPPRDEPFDADAGPDSRGRPVVVYSRCRGDSWDLRGCDLFIHRFGRRGEEPVRTASTPQASEYEPTIWRGRIAYASTRGERTQMLTRNRLAARTLPSMAVRHVPANAEIGDAELRGRLLALRVLTPADDEFTNDDVRLEDLATGRGRRLDRTSAGEGGQQWLGLSFAGDRLGWIMACMGDPGGCADRGRRIYDTRTHVLHSSSDYHAASGWQLAPGGTIVVRGGGGELGDDPLEDPDTRDVVCDDPMTERRERTCPVVRYKSAAWTSR